MSGPAFRFENSKSFRLKGVKHLVKESIIDGEKGLSFVLTKKEGDKFHRLFVKEISKDKFELKEKVDEKETTKEVDMAELKKMLKSNKDLEFVRDYVDKERGSYKGGAKKSSKKGSKKSSKKRSMKGGATVDDLQEGGKKHSKKSSKKGSMRGGDPEGLQVGGKKRSKK